jgi:hypothetical protein
MSSLSAVGGLNDAETIIGIPDASAEGGRAGAARTRLGISRALTRCRRSVACQGGFQRYVVTTYELEVLFAILSIAFARKVLRLVDPGDLGGIFNCS